MPSHDCLLLAGCCRFTKIRYWRSQANRGTFELQLPGDFRRNKVGQVGANIQELLKLMDRLAFRLDSCKLHRVPDARWPEKVFNGQKLRCD